MAMMIEAAWREVGVELTLRDLSEAPAGWLPPLHLRTECSHNLSEPIYDLAHDYAAMDPIFPLPGGPPSVGNWMPRWAKNPPIIEEYAAMLLECDAAAKRARFTDLQETIIDACTSIFIAEVQQTMVANRHVPQTLVRPESRFFQALQYQNCGSWYLPPHC